MPLKVWKYVIAIIILILLSVVFEVNHIINRDTSAQIYTDITKIPKNKVGVLLGTSKYTDKGRKLINTFYQNRIDAAVALYMAGKIDYIIVSGDNSTQYYNEPVQMRDDLIARGVPVTHIYLDNAGFRTLDSILRCRDIFGQSHFTIISQKFHNQRAVYIANHKKVVTVGFCAKDGDEYLMPTIREKLARVKMMIDLLLNKQAQFYGDKVTIK